MVTIREDFQTAIDKEREHIARIKLTKIRHFEIDDDGRKTEVTDQMIADAEATIRLHERALRFLGDLAD